MKKRILLFFTVSIVIFSSCKPKNQYSDIPQKITIAGKIDNHTSDKYITLWLHRIGFEREQLLVSPDSVGNFIAIFESYIPLDIWVDFKFALLLHPGDSLFVQFDEQKYNNLELLLESVVFGGDAAETNQYAAKFQQLYFSNNNKHAYDFAERYNASKEYDADQYLQYLDGRRLYYKDMYDRFVTENQPDDESKKWAMLMIENDYYGKLVRYADEHRNANKMESDDTWDVPKGFYDNLCDFFPIEPSMFINAYALSNFCDDFNKYIRDKMKYKETDGTWAILSPTHIATLNYDSLMIFNNIEFVTDPLLLQIGLTLIFAQAIEKHDIEVYERFRDIADTYIKEPYLKEPLYQKYLQVKLKIENPQIDKNIELKEVPSLSINQIWDDILQQNKHKVIYVDFWATWCGPCLSEFPNSKAVEQELKDKDVAFVYVCLQSDEKTWKSTVDRFQLNGQHYFLSEKQSAEISNLFKIGGIPFYLLIDKNGIVKENGSHLRPFIVRDKIKEMLEYRESD